MKKTTAKKAAIPAKKPAAPAKKVSVQPKNVVAVSNGNAMETMKKIVGKAESEKMLKTYKSISPAFADHILNHLYGSMYAGKKLDNKMRELAAVSCLIGNGNTGIALETHIRGMINVGWKKEEVLEVVLFCSSFAGIASAAEAILTAKKILG